MTSKTSSRPPLAAHRKRLEALIAEAVARRDRNLAEYASLADDGEDVGAGDEEGGSEADQTLVERDRLKATAAADAEMVEELEAALARAGTKSWASCRNCGNDIGAERLVAMPATDLCVSCKASMLNW